MIQSTANNSSESPFPLSSPLPPKSQQPIPSKQAMSGKEKTAQDLEYKKLSFRYGIKEMRFNQKVGLLMSSTSIHVVDLAIGNICKTLRKLSYPRFITLSKNGKTFLAFFSDNTCGLYCTRTCNQIQNIVGIPHLTSVFLLSGNGKKALYGNNQTICLWNTVFMQIELLSQQWKNINCFAINQKGSQIALGTYNGTIYILALIGQQKCRQIELRKHSSCIMNIAFHHDKVISVSHDKIMHTITIQNTDEGKLITYEDQTLREAPRYLQPLQKRVFIQYLKGIECYFNKRPVGLYDSIYQVADEQKQGEHAGMMLFRYQNAQVEWWHFQADKLLSIIYLKPQQGIRDLVKTYLDYSYQKVVKYV